MTTEEQAFYDSLTAEERQVIVDVIKACGCICHYRDALHFRSCCAASSGVKLRDIQPDLK
jgi:hypothetical protein